MPVKLSYRVNGPMLPNLPRKLNKREAKVTPLVIAWFKENYPKSVALEIKVGKNKLLPHQKIALEQVQEGEFAWKIPDMGKRNPFDAFILKDADAFVVVCEGRDCKAERIDGHLEILIHI